jgi:hypothetical protein
MTIRVFTIRVAALPLNHIPTGGWQAGQLLIFLQRGAIQHLFNRLISKSLLQSDQIMRV